MGEENETTSLQILASEVNWQIRDFITLCPGNGKFVASPTFWVSNVKWQIRVYPNGDRKSAEDYISLHVSKITGNDSIAISITFSIKVNKYVIKTIAFEKAFSNISSTWGFSTFILRSELLSELSLVSPTITVVCSVRVLDSIQKKTAQTPSLVNSVKILAKKFEDIFLSHKLSDVKIKVGPKDFSAHKAILGARSPVFSSMFEHEMSEKLNGVIDITDCDTDSFELFLRFLYTGNVDKTTNRDSLGLYKTADKYCIQDLKEICCDFMSESLEIDFICDVLELAIIHEETELLKSAIDFFTINATDIFVTEKWQTFNLEKTLMANEILKQMSANALISFKLKCDVK